MRQAVSDLDERVHACEVQARRLTADWATTIESLEGLEASIEKKRRQAAASASRANGQSKQEEHQPASPSDLLAALNQRIYGASS